jgi:hypothetical protein
MLRADRSSDVDFWTALPFSFLEGAIAKVIGSREIAHRMYLDKTYNHRAAIAP